MITHRVSAQPWPLHRGNVTMITVIQIPLTPSSALGVPRAGQHRRKVAPRLGWLRFSIPGWQDEGLRLVGGVTRL